MQTTQQICIGGAGFSWSNQDRSSSSNIVHESSTRTWFSHRHHIVRNRTMTTLTYISAHTPTVMEIFHSLSYFTYPMKISVANQDSCTHFKYVMSVLVQPQGITGIHSQEVGTGMGQK